MTTTYFRVFIDTNVLIRANIATAPLHTQAQSIIRDLKTDGAELWISRQVLREYLVNITRPQTYASPVTAEAAIAHIQRLETLFQIADDTAQVTAQLLRLLKEHATGGKQIHDANIVATMLAYKIDTLVTQNIEDMQRFESKITLMTLIGKLEK